MAACHLKALLWVGGLLLAKGFDVDGCTSIIVSSGATVDGSAITSHANDCVDCDWRMVYVAARDHPAGAMRTVYSGTWSQYPRLVDPSRSSQYTAPPGTKTADALGSIPEVPHTYALWEASYGLMNEHGLGLGESTCPGFIPKMCIGSGGTALFTVGNLMAVALERCKTARCAIQTMGELGMKYGYCGEDAGLTGGGEAVTVVDKAGESWVFHITGGVDAPAGVSSFAGKRGALWVAQRVPDGHVAVVANSFIIKEVDLTDTENFMVHPGLLELTKEHGIYDGNGPFNWQKIMAPDLATFRYFPGQAPIPMYSTLRIWGVYRHAAPSNRLHPSAHMEDYPFSIQVDKNVTHLDVMNWFRDHYEGTEFDMTLGALAGPWQSPNRMEGGLGGRAVPGQFTRSSSIPRTSYTVLMQTGIPQPVAWFSADQSASSVFVPFFTDVLAHGDGKFDVDAYGVGSMKSFSFTSGKLQPAWWAFDFVANYMEINYKNMSETFVYPKVQKLQKEVNEEAQLAVKAARRAATPEESGKVLALAQTKTQRRVLTEWWSLAEMLVVTYNDGFFNFGPWMPNGVGAIGYPAFWLEMIGYSQESYYPTWFSRNATPPSLLPAAERAVLRVEATTVEESSAFDFLTNCLPSHRVVLALLIGVAGGYKLGIQAAISAQKAAEAKNGGYVKIDP